MYLPDGTARLPDLVGVLRVEHQPAADAHPRLVARNLPKGRHRPARMFGAQARRDLDHNRIAAIRSSGFGQPVMTIVTLVIGAVTIGRLRTFLSCTRQVAFSGHRDALVARDEGRIA